MANSRSPFTKVAYDPTKKNQWGRVEGNPYQYSSKGRNGEKIMWQMVPESFISLKKGNAFIVAKKHIDMGDKNGYHSEATYVRGYSNLGSKTLNGHVRRMHFVARLIYRGGTPALTLYRYCGYSEDLAKQVFQEIPYTSAEYLGKDKQFHSFTKPSMTAQEIVEKKIAAKERLLSKAYGNPEQRKAFALQHPNYFKKAGKGNGNAATNTGKAASADLFNNVL